MANDFTLYIVNWPKITDHFQSSRLGSVSDNEWSMLDPDIRLQVAVDALEVLSNPEIATRLRSLTDHHSASGSFKLWAALGETYSEIRRFLPEEEGEVYDELYLPFIGPWVRGIKASSPPIDFPVHLKSRLERGGMCLALPPEHCKRLSKDFYHYSFSRLVHVALASKRLPPPLPNSASFFHDMIDGVETSLGHLHSSYTEMTEGWRILMKEASHRKWGILAMYQI
jgi:hypothetical protein